MAVQIKGATNLAEVNADAEVKVAPTLDITKPGFVALAAESAPASDQQGTRLIRALEANDDSRLRVVLEKCLYRRVWNNAGQSHCTYTDIATLTVTYPTLSGGGLRLDSALVGTNLARASVLTYRTFKVLPECTLYAQGLIAWSNIQTSATWAFGFSSAAPGQNLPTSGIYIRRKAAGDLEFVVRRNSIDLFTEPINEAGYTLGDYHRVVIGVNNMGAECWIDNELVAKFSFENEAVPKPFMYLNGSMRLVAVRFNEGAAAAGVSLYVAEWSVWESGDGSSQLEDVGAAMRNQVAPYAPSAQGATSASIFVNSTVPTTFTLSNTTCTASSATSGGLMKFAALAGADTDYIVLGYAPHDAFASSGDGGDVFMVTGVNIGAWNLGAANSATVPTTMVFALGFGSTAVSLATADAAATKSPRRVGIGVITIPVSAVIGQAADKNINYTCPTPVPVHSTEFAHLFMRVVSGAATASQFIHMNVQILGYWV